MNYVENRDPTFNNLYPPSYSSSLCPLVSGSFGMYGNNQVSPKKSDKLNSDNFPLSGSLQLTADRAGMDLGSKAIQFGKINAYYDQWTLPSQDNKISSNYSYSQSHELNKRHLDLFKTSSISLTKTDEDDVDVTVTDEIDDDDEVDYEEDDNTTQSIVNEVHSLCNPDYSNMNCHTNEHYSSVTMDLNYNGGLFLH